MGEPKRSQCRNREGAVIRERLGTWTSRLGPRCSGREAESDGCESGVPLGLSWDWRRLDDRKAAFPRGRRGEGARSKRAKWPSIALVGLVAIVAGCAGPSESATPAELKHAYERSIREAATRDPGFAVALRTISPDQATVDVATFTEWGEPPSPTQRHIWVSLLPQLRDMCKGKPDSVLAIQQILGLPPAPSPSRPDHQWQVVTFSAPRTAIFRPCPAGTDTAAQSCSAGGPASDLDEAAARFFLSQLWTSHRVGFDRPEEVGYPFTGMGWSWNWDPASSSHVGVSEYVVRPGATLSDVTSTAPDRFCNPAGASSP